MRTLGARPRSGEGGCKEECCWSGPGKARSPGLGGLGSPAGVAAPEGERRALVARRGLRRGLPRGWERAAQPRPPAPRETSRPGRARAGRTRGRGRFLGEPGALPIKPPPGAKSKRQSPSLRTRRHPISWETATPNDKPRRFSLLRRRGEISTALLGGSGTPSANLACRRSNADASPTRRPTTRALSLASRASWLQRAAARKRRVLTWISQSWKLPEAGRSSTPASPLVLRRRCPRSRN